MKKQNETAATVAQDNEAMDNVPANEATQDTATETQTDASADDKDEDGKTLSAEQVKAKQVLRATLPNLKAANLNFEKRTGNFFAGIIEKVAKLNNDGQPKQRPDGSIIYETDAQGKPVEKLRRLVVELTVHTENDKGERTDTGELKPEYEAARDEINAKRAAALVLDGEKRRKKIEDERAAAMKAVEEAEAKLVSFDADMADAIEIVKAVELPESAGREKLSDVKLRADSAEAKIAAMREKLIAMGIDPDTIL